MIARTPERFAHPLLVLIGCGLLAACGSSQDRLAPPSAPTSPPPRDRGLKDGDATPTIPVPAASDGDCNQGKRTFRFTDKKAIRWLAMKAKIIPVVGHQQASVVFEERMNAGAKTFAMKIDFDPKALDSGSSLRDQRLRTYVLGNEGEGNTLPFQFILKEIHSINLFEIPADGDTIKVTFAGTLSMGGQESELAIPTYVTGTAGGMRISHGDSDLRLNFREQLHMGERLDALMGLANVVMEDEVSLRFDWQLQNVCS